MKLFHSFFKSFFQTPSRVLRIWLLQQLWISNYFAQETMQTFDFQPNSYSFQTIGTNVFPPELASANKFPEFPSSVFPAKLVVQSNDFRKPPEVNTIDYNSDYEYEEYEYDGPEFPEPPGFQEPPGFPEPPGFQESPEFPEPPEFQKPPGFPEFPGFQEPPRFPEPPGFQESQRLQEPPGFQKPPPNFSIFQNSLNSPLPGMFSMVGPVSKFQAFTYKIRYIFL